MRDAVSAGSHFTFVNCLDSTTGVPTVVGTFVNRPKFDKQYLARLRSGGIHAANVTITWPGDDFREAVRKTSAWHDLLERLSPEATLVTSVGELKAAKASGRFAVIFGSQDASMIENRVEYLTAFYLMRHRILQLAYQRRNLIGSGCGERVDEGLSLFGLQVVEAMNHLGMLIDLSHCGPRTTAEAIDVSKDPVAITHSNAQAISGHIRAKSDEHIRAMAEKGGVIGISTLSQYVKRDGSSTGTTIEDYLDQIDYVVKMAGEDHVGIGLDNHEDYSREEYNNFTRQYPELKPRNYDTWVVKELQSVTGATLIVDSLAKRGYSGRQIEKIAGGNFLRLFHDVWGA